MSEPVKKLAYEDVSKYIVDKWLDHCIPITELIEAFLRADEIACYENAALLAEADGLPELANRLRQLKPRQFVFKQPQHQSVDVDAILNGIRLKYNKPKRKR